MDNLQKIANSAENLCLHLFGKLNPYIGAVFGSTGYIRDRNLEFFTKNIPQDELIEKIGDTIIIVDASLEKLTAKQINRDYPLVIFDGKTSTEYFLLHLAMH